MVGEEMWRVLGRTYGQWIEVIIYELSSKGIREVYGDDVDAFGACCATCQHWRERTRRHDVLMAAAGQAQGDVDGEATADGDVEQGQDGGHSGHCDA